MKYYTSVKRTFAGKDFVNMRVNIPTPGPNPIPKIKYINRIIASFFVFTIVKAMGHSREFAITAVLIEGIIFILLSIFKIREIIILSIPMCIKNAISCCKWLQEFND